MNLHLLSRTRARPLVLVVDEDEGTCATYAYALSAMRFEVLTADAVATAHARAWEMRPDIVVTGVASRGGTGWALLRTLKEDQDPRTRDIPVVVLAANATPSVRERAARGGCAALCLKSCPTDRLASGLRSVLERERSA